MNGDLYPTPTRVDLLDEVAAEHVYRYDGHDYVEADGQRFRKVTAALAEMERAGWVVVNGGRWDLTAAGEAVRDAYRRNEAVAKDILDDVRGGAS